MAERHYLRSIEAAVEKEDVGTLVSLVSLNHLAHIYALSDYYPRTIDQRSLNSLPDPWPELIAAHIACIQPRLSNNLVDLYHAQLVVAQYAHGQTPHQKEI